MISIIEATSNQIRQDIRIGSKVSIVLKKDQRTNKRTEGIVKDILTKSNKHTRGIKVRLTDGQVGRVQQIIKSTQTPNILYHASHIQGLKVLDPKYNISNISGSKNKIWLYAGISEKMVSAFTFPWTDNLGIQYGSIGWNSNDPVYTMTIPKKHLPLLNNPCSIYTVNSDNFVEAKGGLEGEYRTKKNVKVLKETKFKSAKECMKYYGIKIKVN